MTYWLHASLLLKIPTTSPIKGYHSALKICKGKINLPPFSLQGIAKLTDVIDQKWHKQAKIGAANFKGAVLPHLSGFSRLEALPIPVQSMIADEVMAANNLFSRSLKEGLDLSKELDNVVKCNCEFFRKY